MSHPYLNACLLPSPGASFPPGETRVASAGGAGTRAGLDPLMDFSIVRLRRGQHLRPIADRETLCVLLDGRAQVAVGRTRTLVERRSLFDSGPFAVHAGAQGGFAITAGTGGSEWAVIATANPRRLRARFYRDDEFTNEDRGAGLAQGTCRRFVRTIFDHGSRPDSNLVVGEVVNFPGRWSSYPPHHHPQPEIYHYRFTLPQGYGHAELGDTVLKVRHGDTVLIPGGLDHAQVSAPGYGMYYLWVVRHLPRRPYRGFTFTAEHTWLLDPRQQGWQPGSERPTAP